MSKPRIGIIVGSVRPNRFADKPASWIAEIASARDDLEVETIDLKDFPLPLFDEPVSPAWKPSQNEVARRWQETVDRFDGFIVTAAEYNHGPAPAMKNALDYAYKEWNRKPVAFVGYGGVGGARAVEQLRLHAVELQMASTKNAVHIVWADMAPVMNGEKSLSDFDHLNKSAEATLDELAWWAKVLKDAREADGVQAKAA
ncbi:MAG: NAD(P)H-dependent oxidoreductase [Rhizobiaceae bacterium]|nr:NAD(P)H-dependent oxidoreductase [Rhizobiaceae bacterium]MCV0408593.1 NAD(P)H-dependent oxidoreductase [Rhizobiaceae bacterium]